MLMKKKSKKNPYEDLEVIGNPNHTEKVVITEALDFTSKIYAFPDMLSKERFLAMLRKSAIQNSVLIKDISLSLN